VATVTEVVRSNPLMRTVSYKVVYLILLVMLAAAVVFAVRPSASPEAPRAVGMTKYHVERQLEHSGRSRGVSPSQSRVP